jgi:hypothetical protein
MSLFSEICTIDSNFLLSIDKYIQELYIYNKLNILYIFLAMMFFIIIFIISSIFDILIDCVYKYNSNIIENCNNINNKMYDTDNKLETIYIDICELKKSLKINNYNNV